MKDFLSKITFGFMMAQLVPGAIATSCLTCLYAIFYLPTANSMKAVIQDAAAIYLHNTGTKIVFFVLSTGVGMLIHGMHWAILANLENRRGGDFHNIWYHKTFLIFEICLAPGLMLWEIVISFFFAKNIEVSTTRENVPEIEQKNIDAFNFLQDFYLHFAQFYAHTAYSMLIMFLTILIFLVHNVFTNREVFSEYRGLLLILSYFLTGIFFVIGRIQLLTLFKAERDILTNT